MESIVSNITGGFLNDILKATAPEREFANYQNIILPELVSAVKKYCAFKDNVLDCLRARKNQPTIKEAFSKCERDVFVKKLNEHETLLKEYIDINSKMNEKIDMILSAKLVDETPNIHMNVVDAALVHIETTTEPDCEEHAPDAEDTTGADEVEETTDEVEVEEVQADATEEEEEVQADATEEEEEVQADATEEEEEVEADATEEEEEVQEEEVEVDAGADAVEEVEVEVEEEDVSEEEIEVDGEEEEEVEEYSHKGKKYYVTGTTNGKIYACTADDDIGDQVGTFKNGKPIFS